MTIKDYFDYGNCAKILQITRLELTFCVAYFGLALIICIYSTPGGSLLSPDSVTYIVSAENLYQNHNFFWNYGSPMYPILIALGMIFGLSSEQSASIIPIICYSLLGFPLFLLGKIISRPFIGYISCIVSLFCGKYLLVVSTWAWTEMPFLFFTVIAILFMAIFNRYGYTRSINFAGIFTFLAILTRYVGFVLIPIGLIVIAINIRDFRKALTMIINFCLISIIPVIIWEFVPSGTLYKIATSTSNHPLGTTMVQFRQHIESFFYNDYKILSIIILLFFIIAIIEICLNKRLTAFTKDTIPLTGFIIIYSIMMILLASSYGNYTIVPQLHLRYMLPIFPFVVLLIFSSFSGIYNIKNTHNILYKILPIILCTLLVAQGANSLFIEANNIRTQSIADYSDRNTFSKFISENNISAQDNIYIGVETNCALFIMELYMHHPRIPYSGVIRSDMTDPKLPGNLTVEWGRSMSARSIADLINDNKNLPIYITTSNNVFQYYIAHPPKDICITNSGRFLRYTIFRAELKQNESCNQGTYPKSDLMGNHSVLSKPPVQLGLNRPTYIAR